jgi:hypothetical protein
MVLRVGVFSEAGLMVVGSVGVTMFHPQGPGHPELPAAHEVMLSSSEDSSRVVCRDGDPLWTIPTNMAPECHS